jgi:monoterpene epsilon-lactone hydrolase
VFELDPYHWGFCAELANRLGCTVDVPIYPLAPEHSVDEALAMVTAVYRELAPERIALVGDSAGGGMALALAQRLAAEGLPEADDVVLLSPWVDIAMDNPEIPAVAERDPWLAVPGLIEAGRLYAGDVGAKDPRVSPIHGDLSKLRALSIFIGTRDVFLPDARLLAKRATEQGATVRLHEYEEMVHDFMLIQLLPEAKRALADIEAVLARS